MYIRSALQKDDLMTFTKQPLSLQSWRFEIFLHHFFFSQITPTFTKDGENKINKWDEDFHFTLHSH